MAISITFRQSVRDACYNALESCGFSRYQRHAADWPIDDDFHVWIGLNEGLNIDSLEISPFIGIHSIKVEKLWTSLKVGPYQSLYKRSTATYSIHLGEICPNELAFIFSESTDITSEARRLARLYRTDGIQYGLSISNYHTLLSLLKGRIESLGGYPERVACCLYFMGREKDARIFTEMFARVEPDYFKDFADPFIEILDGARLK